jgi:hypothetical protein
MDITMMKTKTVMVGIKNGMTLDDFCQKYQCSSEAFEERMKQIYGHNKKQLKHCFTQIVANEKKARKEAETDETEEVAEVTEVSETTEEDQVPVSMSRSEELKYLAELEKQQVQSVVAKESEHKELAAEHRSYKTSLRELRDKIDKMMVEFQHYHQEFEEILSKNAVVEARMNEISAEWNTERTALADTRSRIEELSVVTLSVYNSGEISQIDGPEIELDDAGWGSTREVLLTEDECQELRLKDITTLAKLLMIAEHSDRKIEAMCDNAELEIAFRKLRSK